MLIKKNSDGTVSIEINTLNANYQFTEKTEIKALRRVVKELEKDQRILEKSLDKIKKILQN